MPAVAEIGRRLDGLPLAIELAATRAAALGVDPLRERLGESLDLLGGAERVAAGLGGRPVVAGLAELVDASLAAADRAPSAPAVTGDDVERYQRLARTLGDRVDAEAHERSVALAAMLPRAQIVDRARAAVSELRTAGGFRPNRPG